MIPGLKELIKGIVSRLWAFCSSGVQRFTLDSFHVTSLGSMLLNATILSFVFVCLTGLTRDCRETNP